MAATVQMKTAIIAAAATLSACATTPTTDPAATATAPATPQEDGYVLTRIAEPALPPGECGIVLWTLERDRPAAVFKYLVDGEGAIAINGAPLKLTLVDGGGAGAFGVLERQRYVDETGAFDVAVTVELGLEFNGGAYVERGLIAIEAADGWKTVTPVAGITGCRG
ncbi:MAG: hypothetical protein AAGJ87_06615 [Pseudomonadota bacterium]